MILSSDIMAQPSNAISIVGSQYSVPYPMNLVIPKKVLTLSNGKFGVTDSAGNIIFKVKGVLFTFINERRKLLDPAGVPIITLQSKAMSAHSRWHVFRGDSHEASNMIFSVKTSSIFFLKTKWHVFLARNTSEEVCDFRVEGNWFDRSCKIYVGDSETVIAEMHKKHPDQSISVGKGNYVVTVHPNVDHAFIVALIVILEEINHTSTSTKTDTIKGIPDVLQALSQIQT